MSRLTSAVNRCMTVPRKKTNDDPDHKCQQRDRVMRPEFSRKHYRPQDCGRREIEEGDTASKISGSQNSSVVGDRQSRGEIALWKSAQTLSGLDVDGPCSPFS